MLKRNSMRFAAALLVALASLVAAPNGALAGAPQHHDQVPGFYRLMVGDIEALAKWKEGDDGWCRKGTARRSAHAGCC